MTANTEQMRKTIERHNANAVRWYATGDVDSLVTLFSKDAWQMPPHQPALAGRSSIRNFWRDAVRWGKWDFTLTVQAVTVGHHIAVERGTYDLRFTAGASAPPGMSSFEDRGNYLVHWQHEPDGEWRIVADAPVSELPLPTMPR